MMKNDARWDPQMRAVLARIEASAGSVALPTLTIPFDNYRVAADEARLKSIDKGGPELAEISDLWIPACGRRIFCRMFRPTTTAALPILVFFHGGGWVWGSVDTHDRLAREYAHAANVCVISVDYSLSPEAPFPRAVEECAAVVRWLARHAGRYGLAVDQIAVGGDSAGANIAFGGSLLLKDGHEEIVRAILAAYPVCGPDLSTPSYSEFEDGYFLTKASMEYFWKAYTPQPVLRTHPYANLVGAQLSRLPPVYLQLAELDVLRSEGETLYKHLNSAGVATTLDVVPGVAHGFLMHPESIDAAAQAISRSSKWLAQEFKTI